MAVVTSLSQPSLALARLANHRTQLLDWQTTEPSCSTGKPQGTLTGYVEGDVCGGVTFYSTVRFALLFFA